MAARRVSPARRLVAPTAAAAVVMGTQDVPPLTAPPPRSVACRSQAATDDGRQLLSRRLPTLGNWPSRAVPIRAAGRA